MTVSKWLVTTCAKTLRRMGKLGEELSELGAVTNRIIIQGIDEIDPSSGQTNRVRLLEEIADVYAQLDLTMEQLNFSWDAVVKRAAHKKMEMRAWEAMFADNDTDTGKLPEGPCRQCAQQLDGSTGLAARSEPSPRVTRDEADQLMRKVIEANRYARSGDPIKDVIDDSEIEQALQLLEYVMRRER